MSYALVTFAFCGGDFDRKKYLFETEVQELEKGDLVLVEGPKKDTTAVACFINYVEFDRYNQFKRKRILRKIKPKCYVEKLIPRVKKLRNLYLPNSVCNAYRNYFFFNEDFDNNEARLRILRNLVMAAIQFEDKEKKIVKYRFGDMLLVTKGDRMTTIQSVQSKYKWVRPAGLSDEIDSMLQEL